MRKYRLTQAADKDLYDIYNYTFREFGEIQADVYFKSLEESLANLVENPELGVDVSDVREGYRRFTHDRHSFYYQTENDVIVIVRVLGPGMSPDLNL